MAERLFGVLLASAGLVSWGYAWIALRRGSLRLGDNYGPKPKYRREDAPRAFWFGMAFYVLLGLACVVLGVLAAIGVISSD